MSESWNRPEGSGPTPQGPGPQGQGPQQGRPGPQQPARPPQQGGGYGPPGQQPPGYGAPQQQPGGPQGGQPHPGRQGPQQPQPGAQTQPPAYGAPPGGWQQAQGTGPGGGYTGQPTPPSTPSKPKDPVSTVQVVRYVLAGLSAALVVLGVSLPINGDTMWAENTMWTIFAVVAALATVALAFVQATKDILWLIGVSGLIALALFWVLIMLPGITSDNGFLVTVGLGLAALGFYLANEASAGSSAKEAAESAAKTLR